MKALLIIVTALATAPLAGDSFSDAKVINKLHHVDTLNTELGSLAKQRGGTDKIRKLGDRMAKDHQKLEAQVSAYAKDRGLTFEDELQRVTVTGDSRDLSRGATGGKDDVSGSGAAAPGGLTAPGNPGGSNATNRNAAQMGTATPNSYSTPGTGGPGAAYEQSGSSATGKAATNSYGTEATGDQGARGSTGSQGQSGGSSYDKTSVPAKDYRDTMGAGRSAAPATGMANADEQLMMKQRGEAKLGQLRSLQGAEFDSQFLTDMIDGSQKCIGKLQGWKGQGDRKLDALIDSSLRVLQTELKDARQLQRHTPAA